MTNQVGVNRGVTLVVQAQQDRDLVRPALTRSAMGAILANVVAASPAHAGVLFDFNLTLPIIAGQFLVLMFIMDKLVYTPVGEVLDKRDKELRDKLMMVKDNSSELDALAAEAGAVLSAARGDAARSIQAAKKKTETECNEKLAAAKKKIDKELESALLALETKKQDSLNNLDATVDKLSQEIVEKVLPA